MQDPSHLIGNSLVKASLILVVISRIVGCYRGHSAAVIEACKGHYVRLIQVSIEVYVRLIWSDVIRFCEAKQVCYSCLKSRIVRGE